MRMLLVALLAVAIAGCAVVVCKPFTAQCVTVP